MNAGPGILNLPVVPLLKIFDYFTDDTAVMRKILAPVCKKFYNLANDSSFLHKIQFYRRHNETSERLKDRFELFCSFMLSLQERHLSSEPLSQINTLVINVEWCLQIISPAWSSVCEHLHRLQTLSISRADLNNSFLATLPSSLTHLHLWWVGVPDNFFQPLHNERVLPNLKCLHLVFRFLGHPHLQLSDLVSRAPKLESLSMASPQWPPSSIFSVLRNATNLKSLSIAGNLTEDSCASLPHVITSFCPNLKYLKSDHLYFDPSSFALFYSLSRLTKLKQLSFSTNCSTITIEDFWSLCKHLGPSVKVKIYLRSDSSASIERHIDWATHDIQCDNLDIALADSFQSLSVACIPSSSTEPCFELYGSERPSIFKLC